MQWPEHVRPLISGRFLVLAAKDATAGAKRRPRLKTAVLVGTMRHQHGLQSLPIDVCRIMIAIEFGNFRIGI